MVNVRSAVLNDLEPLSALLDGYRQFYKQPSNIQAARDFLDQRMGLGDSFILVSENSEGMCFHGGLKCSLDAKRSLCATAVSR